MRHLRLVVTLICITTGVVSADPVRYELSSLRPDCAVQEIWIGLWPVFPKGVELRCGDVGVVVTHPNNFVGHVRIVTPQQALEFVRLFTQPTTHKLFLMGGRVEVVPSDAPDDDRSFNEVPAAVFTRRFAPARVVDRSDAECRPGIPLLCGKEFEITRVVVDTDQRILQIVEVVWESGVYNLVSERVVMRDATRIGVMHFGD